MPVPLSRPGGGRGAPGVPACGLPTGRGRVPGHQRGAGAGACTAAALALRPLTRACRLSPVSVTRACHPCTHPDPRCPPGPGLTDDTCYRNPLTIMSARLYSMKVY